jgi:hypothetical protein
MAVSVRVVPVVFVALAAVAAAAPVTAAEAPRVSARVDAVLEHSALTGRPVLAVCCAANCVVCPRLRQRLAGDPVATQFLRIDLAIADTDEWKAWQAFADTRAWASPQVYVVRADGEILLSGRAQSDMSEELRAVLPQAGMLLTEQEAALARKLLEKARPLAAAGDRSGALREIAPALAKRSFARAAVAARDFGGPLAEELEQAVEAAPAAVGDDAAGITVAVGLVGVVRDCGGVAPEIVRAAVPKLVALKKDPTGAEVVRQAEQIHAAIVTARTSPSRGRALLEKIVAGRPDSGAAEVARAVLATLPSSDRP